MFTFMNRLQTQIFTFFVLLLLVIQAVSFWFTYSGNQQLERQQLGNQLSMARLVFESENANRNYYLAAFADTAAKDFGLKDIFIDGEERSFLVALNNHRKRINADMAIAVSSDGKVIGQLVFDANEDANGKVQLGSEQNTMFRFQLDQDFQSATTLYRLGDRIYQIRFAPLTSGVDATIGWVGFGYIIDNTLAEGLHTITGLNAGFLLSDDQNNVSDVAYSSEKIAPEDHAIVTNYIHNDIANFDYLLWKETVGTVEGNTLFAYMFVKREAVLAKLQNQWAQQLLLIFLMLPLSLLVAFLIARNVTKPIKLLIGQARSIAHGNYTGAADVGSSIEMQTLSNEFTFMRDAINDREQKITHQAQHDPLTNLPNRSGLDVEVSQWLKAKHPIVIMLLNIRRITDVNVTLGHAVGDEVIKEVGRRLADSPEIDLVCRLSGDEFVLAYKQLPTERIKHQIAQIADRVDKEYRYQDITLHLQVTLGISCHSPDSTLVSLLRQADTALHHAKKQKLHAQIYDIDIDKNTLSGFQLLNDLKGAIELEQLVLFYQPKLSLTSGFIEHVEALVRWQHPIKGLVFPDVFIPLAEKAGQMNALSRWVFQEVLRQHQRWQASGITLSISVNVSAENIANPEFCQWVLDETQRQQVPPSDITIEITEDAVLSDPEAAIEVLCQWRDFGFTLSIDDYGTGYSSLAQLKKLPVEELKIDKSFVMQLMTEIEDQVIVRSTIQLAHNLSLSVVAEGVEDAETMAWLLENGCEKVQGYFISKAVPADSLALWLKDSPYHNGEK